MASLNKAMLIGNITRDIDARQTANGTSVVSLSLATNEKFKNKNGDWEERTEFHNVTFFGKLAGIVQEYCSKGQSIYVEGRISTDKYTDKNGVEKYSTKIIADRMQMLGSKDGGKPRSGGDGSRTYEAPMFDDSADIPFLCAPGINDPY